MLTAQTVQFRCVPLFTAAALYCLFSSTQLTANVQTAAGIISLVNDYLISRGRSPLGFFNPWLYSYGFNGKALKDVKFGGNPGCGDVGFMATSGWDPVRPSALMSFLSVG